MTALAQVSLLWGFCPVINFPSTQTLGFQSSARSKFPPCSFSFCSSRNGTLLVSWTASSSVSVKPVTVKPFTRGSVVPDHTRHMRRSNHCTYDGNCQVALPWSSFCLNVSTRYKVRSWSSFHSRAQRCCVGGWRRRPAAPTRSDREQNGRRCATCRI